MSRAPHAPGGFAEPYARYRRSSHGAPPPRSSAIETALVDLERALCRDRCHAVVDAAPGSGKALLARALGERLASSFHVVHLPKGIRDDEVPARILTALGESPGRDPEVRLLSVLYEIGSRGSALALLVDDAGALSAEALRRLGRLAAVARPDLRLALFVTPRAGGDAIRRVVAALGVGAEKVVLQPRIERARPASRPPPPPEPPPSPREPLAPRPEPARPAPPARAEEKGLARFRVPRPRPRSRWTRPARGLRLALGGGLVALALYALTAPLPGEPGADSGAGAPDVSAQAGVRAAGFAPEPAAADPVPPEAEPVSAAPPAEAVPATARSEAAADAADVSPGPAPIPVSLNARPWARIEVDGREVGVTPLANLPLAPGLHRFRAHFPDGRVIERTTHIDAYRDHVVFP